MGYRTLELTLISAKDLKNVNLIGKMDVYVVVHLSDDPKNKQKTPVHQDGGTNPSWNYTMRFTVNEDSATKPGKYLVLHLKHEHTFGADKDLGEVLVSFKELLDSIRGKDPGAPQFVTYQVKKPSGKPQGELKFSYKFVDMGLNQNTTAAYPAACSSKPSQSCSSSSYASAPYPPPGPAAQPYPPPPAGYPAAQQASPAYPPPAAAGYPAPQQGPAPTAIPYAAPQGYPPYGGYPPTPPAGYGYPPQGPAGYPGYPLAGYPVQTQKPQKPKKNNFGMGLGAGLIGGALGGLVLGEMVEDVYDAGFDDGGFDF